MAHRILVQVVVTGAQVFGRSLVQAYKQAAATAAPGVSTTGAAGDPVATALARETGGITLEESCRILNIRAEDIQAATVRERFEHLFAANSREKGGSLYLQSKVFRAKQRVDAEIEAAASSPEATPDPK
ncbi:uncharacterized protein V1518DRAFT_420734 [Limtongia smithiae]|uniref:uncharacterized protein n=1 Tax=Limtongia smithiae TaxID=1125753 RepID=UPI0034CDDC39